MTPKKFEEIADNINIIGNAYITFLGNTPEQGALRWDDRWRKDLQKSYEERIKPDLKAHLANDVNGIVDRHKIAAALVLAIIEEEPLISSFGDKGSQLVREANVLLSIDAGALVLFAFGVEEASLTNNTDLAKIYDSSGFQYPAPSNGEAEYRKHFCQTLRLMKPQKPHPLLIAHLFFLLQRHFEAWRAAELCMGIGALDPTIRRKNLEKFLA